MKLDDAQKQKVSGWIAEGMKLADIQKRIGTDFGLSLTYMDVRFLVDDLKLVPKDPEPPKNLDLAKAAAAAPAAASAPASPADAPLPPEAPVDDLAGLPPAGPSNVKVTVDTIAHPGAMVSGKVTFSDGKSAQWFLDQMGRLGLSPETKGYKPPPGDVEDFQYQLQMELQKMGF